MSEKEMQELLKFERKYANKWIAKSRKTGEVIGSRASLGSLATKLKLSHKKDDYVLEKIMSPDVLFVPEACGL